MLPEQRRDDSGRPGAKVGCQKDYQGGKLRDTHFKRRALSEMSSDSPVVDY